MGPRQVAQPVSGAGAKLRAGSAAVMGLVAVVMVWVQLVSGMVRSLAEVFDDQLTAVLLTALCQ